VSARNFCFAGGGGTFRSSTAPAGGAGAWSSHASPQEPVPRSVSCPSRNLCVGVTYKGEVWSSTEPRGDRLAWKVASVDEGEHNTLYGISCPTASVTAGMERFTGCMRSNGVPGFPEPTGASFNLSGTHLDPHSPQYKTAEARCGPILQAVDSGGEGRLITRPPATRSGSPARPRRAPSAR
jgi:hypothetical protein